MADPTEKQLGETGHKLDDIPTEVLEMICGYLRSQGAIRSLSNWASTSRHYHQCLARQVLRSIQVTNIQERTTSLELALATTSRNRVEKMGLLAIYRKGTAFKYNQSIPIMLLEILPERHRFPYLKSIDIYIDIKVIYCRNLSRYHLDGIDNADIYDLMSETWNELTSDIEQLEEASWQISYITQSNLQSAETGISTRPLALAAEDTIRILGSKPLQAQEIQINPAANLLEGMRGQNITLRSKLGQCQERPFLSVLRLHLMRLPHASLLRFLSCNSQLKTISITECVCIRPDRWCDLFQRLNPCSLPRLTDVEIEDSTRYYREIQDDTTDNDASYMPGMMTLRTMAQMDPNYKIFPYIKNDGSIDIGWTLGLTAQDNEKYWDMIGYVKNHSHYFLDF